jgi:hypothetical protein
MFYSHSVTTREKNNICTSVSQCDFDGSKRGGALLHPQGAQSRGHSHWTLVSTSAQYTLFIDSVQMAPSFRWQENRALRWFAVRATLAQWSRQGSRRYTSEIPCYVIQKALCSLYECKIMCLCILYNIVYREKLNLRWVRHSLDGNQNTDRVAPSHGLIEVLI